MNTTKKKSASDPLVASSTILIDGKAFEAGDKITGVPKDEIDRAVSQRRVVRKSVFDEQAQGVPAPAIGSAEEEDNADPDADADADAAAGGSGE